VGIFLKNKILSSIIHYTPPPYVIEKDLFSPFHRSLQKLVPSTEGRVIRKKNSMSVFVCLWQVKGQKNIVSEGLKCLKNIRLEKIPMSKKLVSKSSAKMITTHSY
jgi:hypothetical protein